MRPSAWSPPLRLATTPPCSGSRALEANVLPAPRGWPAAEEAPRGRARAARDGAAPAGSRT
eukprot:12031903-Alexandrium_andersonii.AAC.1